MKSIFSILSLFLILITQAQENSYPQDYFRSPVNGRIYLSGTFGELRSNHFHAGIDIKTGGVIGKNIYAAADGYISRIKISPFGYGHALYIQHPNGYTTVYGHLNEILGEVGEYVEKQQYKRQKFAVDLYLKEGQFPLTKGDTIALSGNTGGSGGPHLHFEIRETATQEPINPLLFGFEVKDFLTPLIRSLKIYPAEENALINGKNKAQILKLKGWGKDYQLKNSDTIQVSGDFYLGINTIDKQNDSNNKNGVYQIELWVDSSQFYMHNVERINFTTSRYLNTLIDFEYYKKHQSRYQRSYISPNNKLKIYKNKQNRGVISFQDTAFHSLQYVVKDLAGNKSILSFIVQSVQQDSNLGKKEDSNIIYNPLVYNQYEDSNLRVAIPAKALYDTLSFHCSLENDKNSANGWAYQISDIGVGLQKRVNIRLKNLKIDPAFKEQSYIGESYKGKIYPTSAIWEENDLLFKTRDFGKYIIAIDSVPPQLRLLRAKNPSIENDSIKLFVEDKESGINSYHAWLDGSWILLKWDPKSKSMFCIPKEGKKGKTLKIRISDKVGNISEQDFKF